MNLSFGYRATPRPGYLVVASEAQPGVDVVHDITVTPWPWTDSSVEEIMCDQLLQYLDPQERATLFNEAYRVLEPKGKIIISAPHWSSATSYEDVTVKYPPISEHFFRTLNAEYVKNNRPKLAALFKCDFSATYSYKLADWLAPRSDEFRNFAIMAYKDSVSDIVITCVSNKPKT